MEKPRRSGNEFLLGTIMGLLLGGLAVLLLVHRFDGQDSTVPIVAEVVITTVPQPTSTPEPTRTPEPTKTAYPSPTPLEWCSYFDEHGTDADIGRKCKKDLGPQTPTPIPTPVDCDTVDGGKVCTWTGENHDAG